MIPTERFAQVEVRSAAEIHDWLSANHAQTDPVWLVTFKKAPGAPYVSVAEILDAVIAWGWVDGIRRKLDAARTMQVIAPRQQQAWAQSYKDRAARLIAEGRMQAPGLAAVEAGHASGQWDHTAAVDALSVPVDLRYALDAVPTAARYFDTCPPSYRRNVLRWLHLAKRAETRATRIATIVTASGQATRLPQM